MHIIPFVGHDDFTAPLLSVAGMCLPECLKAGQSILLQPSDMGTGKIYLAHQGSKFTCSLQSDECVCK